jgi:hypothetical protein
MHYKIREIIPSGAIVDFADGSWAEVPMLNTDSRADFEVRLSEYASHETEENPTWAINAKGLEGDITPKKQADSNVGLNTLDLPTSDPKVAGKLWRDGTDLKVSIG